VDAERGLGLGLAIAERTARLLGCKLSLRSWPGRGSVFAVSVPLGERSAMQRAPVLRVSDPDRVAGAVVMCVENEPAVLSGIQALLSHWGCDVLAARNRESALATIDGRVPDLLLIDYHLDDAVSGVVVAEELQAKWNGTVPGIIITADQTQRSKQDAAARGFHVLQKPLKPAVLRAMMNRMLA
jgi:CheY-like chemotaxis protein